MTDKVKQASDSPTSKWDFSKSISNTTNFTNHNLNELNAKGKAINYRKKVMQKKQDNIKDFVFNAGNQIQISKLFA